MGQMKQWDVATPGLLTKVNFVGIEDTTELNENPVHQAEHWHQNTTIFLKTMLLMSTSSRAMRTMPVRTSFPIASTSVQKGQMGRLVEVQFRIAISRSSMM